MQSGQTGFVFSQVFEGHMYSSAKQVSEDTYTHTHTRVMMEVIVTITTALGISLPQNVVCFHQHPLRTHTPVHTSLRNVLFAELTGRK